jgi:hypothetical protein
VVGRPLMVGARPKVEDGARGHQLVEGVTWWGAEA